MPAPAFAPWPRAAYTSPEWFAAEQERLFTKSWLFIGLAGDAPSPGGYWAVDAGPCPLIITNDGVRLHAFHNRCRHRGAKLVEGRGEAKLITCFYHRWCYQLDGRLRGIPSPDRFPREDRPAGLDPAQIATWNGLLFVNADPQAEPFEAWLGAAADHLAPWRIPELAVFSRRTHHVRANWKLVLENHLDGYHLAHLHKDSLTGLDHGAQRWWMSGRNWLFFQPVSQPGRRSPSEPAGLPAVRHGGSEGMGSSVFLLFPTFAGAGGESFFAILNVTPVAPAETRIDEIFLTAPLSRPRRAFLKAAIAVRRTPDLIAEDVRAAEAVQSALSAPDWTEGPLATGWEDAIRLFRANVAEAVGEGGEGATRSRPATASHP